MLWWLVSSIFLWIKFIAFIICDSWLSRRKLGWASNDSSQFILPPLGVPEGVRRVNTPRLLCLGKGAEGGYPSCEKAYSLIFPYSFIRLRQRTLSFQFMSSSLSWRPPLR